MDAAIDANDIGTLKQYIRDLQEGKEEVEQSAIEAEADLEGLVAKERDLKSRVDELNENIEFINGDGIESNDHLAMPLEIKLIIMEKEISPLRAGIEDARGTMESLYGVAHQLDEKLASIRSRVHQLEVKERAAKGKERAAKAISSVSELDLKGYDQSIDSITAKIDKDSRVADIKLRRALGKFGAGKKADDDLKALAAARLEIRKAKLKKG